METKHTSGPWHVGGSASSKTPIQKYDYARVWAKDGAAVCEISIRRQLGTKGASQEELDNARLIAAAPDLLAALKDLLPMWGSGIAEPWVIRARAAIAKAEGKP